MLVVALTAGAVAAGAGPALAAGPVVSSFSPTSGTIGTKVTITRSGFSGAFAVTFGNPSATTLATVKSDTTITATVPATASTGPVSVLLPATSGSSTTKFTVQPSIVLSANSGHPAGTVTLSGAGFGKHALIGTGFVLGILVVLRPLVEWIDRHNVRVKAVVAEYRLAVVCTDECHPVVRALLDQHFGPASGFRLGSTKTGKSKRRKSVVLRVAVSALPPNDPAIQALIDRLLAEPGVSSASWEKSTHAPE